jgi:SAM-dependent methyltransferase
MLLTSPRELVLYDSKYYQELVYGSLCAARIILPAIFSLVNPKSVVDIGCGIGTWLRAAIENGVRDVVGVDGDHVKASELQIPKDCFQARDLSEAFSLGRQFDLAICLEVAEHLPSASADGLVYSLTKLAPAILFSAAIPFQGGAGHLNEQWPSYWANVFRKHEYYFCDYVRMKFWKTQGIPFWYVQNTFIVANSSFISSHASLISVNDPVLLVHPQVWVERNVAEKAIITKGVKLISELERQLSQRSVTDEDLTTFLRAFRDLISGQNRSSCLPPSESETPRW